MAELDSKILTLEDVSPIATEIKNELQSIGSSGPVGEKGDPGKNVTVAVTDNSDGSHKIVLTYYENDEEQTEKTKEIIVKDGRSIKNVYTDNNNNVYTTFSDGETKKVGTLEVDIQADFLTENGFGKLRYYQGKFQYFDDERGTWIDATVDPQNPYILQMIPNPMKFFVAQFDTISKKYRLRWKEPEDTDIEGQTAVIVEKVIIRRKKDSVPTGIADGEEVLTIDRGDFFKHQLDWYIDSTNEDTENVTEESMWHYKAFPVATTGFANTSSKNEPIMDYKDYHLFGMVLDQNESNPDSMIQYIEDNKDYIPAHMDFDNDKFEYGSWKSFVDDILQVKPCLMEESNISGLRVLNPKTYLKKKRFHTDRRWTRKNVCLSEW